jgi:hypothetical protein
MLLATTIPIRLKPGKASRGAALGRRHRSLRQTGQVADSPNSARDLDRALAEPVFCSGVYRPFGELGAADARALAEELKAAGGWGPMSKVAAVARSWSELAKLIETEGAATVGELDPAQIVELARRTWVLPPPGGLL